MKDIVATEKTLWKLHRLLNKIGRGAQAPHTRRTLRRTPRFHDLNEKTMQAPLLFVTISLKPKRVAFPWLHAAPLYWRREQASVKMALVTAGHHSYHKAAGIEIGVQAGTPYFQGHPRYTDVPFQRSSPLMLPALGWLFGGESGLGGKNRRAEGGATRTPLQVELKGVPKPLAMTLVVGKGFPGQEALQDPCPLTVATDSCCVQFV